MNYQSAQLHVSEFIHYLGLGNLFLWLLLVSHLQKEVIFNNHLKYDSEFFLVGFVSEQPAVGSNDLENGSFDLRSPIVSHSQRVDTRIVLSYASKRTKRRIKIHNTKRAIKFCIKPNIWKFNPEWSIFSNFAEWPIGGHASYNCSENTILKINTHNNVAKNFDF